MTGVGIIGAGSCGWAIAYLCETNGRGKATIWTRSGEVVRSINDRGINPKIPCRHILGVRATSDLAELFDTSEIIFVAVPTRAFRETMKMASKHLREHHIMVSASKGFEDRSYKRMTEIIMEETGCKKVGVISGPNFSAEILMNYPSATVVASSSDDVIDRVRAVLHTRAFGVFPSHDVVGVEICGALKNVYAIVAGMIDSLGFRTNTFSALISGALTEMIQFGTRLGASFDTFVGLAGVGDLVATSSSDLSRNRRFGKLVASGLNPQSVLSEMGEIVEGYFTARVAFQMSREMRLNLKILRAVHDVLYENADPKTTISELFSFS